MSGKNDALEELNELLETAKELFAKADDGWRDVRKRALEDMRFYLGEQWDEQLLKVAKLRKEPSLSVNRLPVFVKQIENELRQREMAINVHATDEIGSDETANIFTSLIRSIEQQSHAKSHYLYAAGENGALVPGFGFLKVETDYEGPNSFNQVVKITSAKDPMKIMPEPTAMEPDFSDSGYWFEFDDYPEDTFKKLWPKAECNSADLFPQSAPMSKWIGENGIRVAKFWYKEETTKVYYLLDDGSIVTSEQLQGPGVDDDEDDDNRTIWLSEDGTEIEDPTGESKVILRRREVTACKIKWASFTGAEILEEGEWAGDFFPFVAITGPITIVDGERDIRGIIRNCKDSQKMLNFAASSAARRIGSANKSPWIVDQASIKPYEAMWRTANTENWAYLPYNAYDANANGKQNPAPVRADQTGQIMDLLQFAAKFENDLKSTIGIYDAGLGATPNEQSGVAIKTLAQQGANSNYHFSDNLVRSLQHLGTILVNIIPRIYDTARVVRIVGADSQQKVVKINQLFNDNGKEQYYALSEGNYGVTVNVGPAFATQKQAAIEQILELTRVNPNVLPYVQDVIVGAMDFPGKEIIRDRLIKVLALTQPQLLEGTPAADIPPQALAQMNRQVMMIKQLTEQMQVLQQEHQKLAILLSTKQVEFEHNTALQAQKTRDAMAQEAQKARNDKELEAVRALRDDQNDLRRQELESIKVQLGHTEKTMKFVMDAIKTLGVEGGMALTGAIDTKAPTIVNKQVPYPQQPTAGQTESYPSQNPLA